MEKSNQKNGMPAYYVAYQMVNDSGNTLEVELLTCDWGILSLQSVIYPDQKRKVIRERRFNNKSNKNGKSTFERAFGYYGLGRYSRK